MQSADTSVPVLDDEDSDNSDSDNDNVDDDNDDDAMRCSKHNTEGGGRTVSMEDEAGAVYGGGGRQVGRSRNDASVKAPQ